MKFEITKEEIQKILDMIQEAPAKYTFSAIQILLNLKPIEEKKEDNASK